jgi:hypothetical protein
MCQDACQPLKRGDLLHSKGCPSARLHAGGGRGDPSPFRARQPRRPPRRTCARRLSRPDGLAAPGPGIRSAGALAERHAVHGYHAIHLAALLQAGGPAHGAFCLPGQRSPCPARRLGTSSFLVDGPRLPRRSPSYKRHRPVAGLCGTLHPAPKCRPVNSRRVPSPMTEPERTRIQVIQGNLGLIEHCDAEPA